MTTSTTRGRSASTTAPARTTARGEFSTRSCIRLRATTSTAPRGLRVTSQYFGQAVANPDNTPNGYYSFNLGTWHIDALNSNCSDSGCSDPLPGTTTTAQNTWLQNDLAHDTSACTLAMWHHPLFSSGWTLGSPGVAPLWNALYQAHADIVLGGHDHLYERYAQQDPSGTATTNGIREFVVGNRRREPERAQREPGHPSGL